MTKLWEMPKSIEQHQLEALMRIEMSLAALIEVQRQIGRVLQEIAKNTKKK